MCQKGLERALQPQCPPAVPLPGCSPSRNQKLELGNKLSSSGNPADTFHPGRFITQCLQSFFLLTNQKSVHRFSKSCPTPKTYNLCHHSPCFALLPPVTVERNMSPPFQHQKHLLDHSWCGYGLDKTQRGSKDTKSSLKMRQDQQSEGTKGFICNEITGIGPLDMSLKAQPLI